MALAASIVVALALASPRHAAAESPALEELMMQADELPAAEVERRAVLLARAPGLDGADAALWLAEWLRRTGRDHDALVRYAEVVARWPDTEPARIALRGSAGTALVTGDWDLAESLARQLPAAEPADQILREDLLAAAARGRTRATWVGRSWLALLLAIAALAASLVEASVRGGRRRPVLAPPSEVIFLAPVIAVLIGVALTTHELIAPAVVIISIGGLALAYLSGATLDTLRARGRALRIRALAHALLCILGVAALLYIALMQHQLLDLVIETMTFGPER